MNENSELMGRFNTFKQQFHSRLEKGDKNFALKKLHELIGFCNALAALYEDEILKDKSLVDNLDEEVKSLLVHFKNS